MKKILIILITIILIVNLTGCSNNDNNSKISIIATSFPGYDFARAIVKDVDDVNIKMLLKPGSEMHDYEPTPKDIININNSDIFIYVGGDSDSWIDDILKTVDTNKTKIVKLMDLVDVKKEEIVEGMEVSKSDEDEYDEHVWTSPVNAITIINKLKNIIEDIDYDNILLYEKNATAYINQLNNIDNEIKDIVKNAKRNELVFGDRFPFRYFALEYNLTYYAAFNDCSDATEASTKTVSFLINKVKSDKIPVVLKIELSNGNIANTIAKETGAKVLELASAHNISSSDFDSGITYVDIMKNNIEVLKEALN